MGIKLMMVIRNIAALHLPNLTQPNLTNLSEATHLILRMCTAWKKHAVIIFWPILKENKYQLKNLKVGKF